MHYDNFVLHYSFGNSYKNCIVVRPSVRPSVVYGKYLIVALILFFYWPIDLKFGLNIGCGVQEKTEPCQKGVIF